MGGLLILALEMRLCGDRARIIPDTGVGDKECVPTYPGIRVQSIRHQRRLGSAGSGAAVLQPG